MSYKLFEIVNGSYEFISEHETEAACRDEAPVAYRIEEEMIGGSRVIFETANVEVAEEA